MFMLKMSFENENAVKVIANRTIHNMQNSEDAKAFLLTTIYNNRFLVIANDEKAAEHYYLTNCKVSELAQIDDINEL